ncbi:MAG: MGH1-like glycoside hydrolase domain-containing protein, partial [Candidatus Dormibacteraceae bacterium]
MTGAARRVGAPGEGAGGALRALAEATLRANSRGDWTVPSPVQYPHQWNWDSGFAALGWLQLEPERAAREIDSLLAGRWRDGMVPHLRYSRAAIGDYFPGPDWWPGAEGRVADGGQLTSGISNPPVAVVAAHRVGLSLPGPVREAFWSRVLPHLRAWLLWFLEARVLPGSPLPVTVHPWETGWDDSPRWDFLGRAGLRPRRGYRRLDTRHVPASQRPREKDYEAYLALAEMLDASGYDLARYRAVSPFCVHDVVLDSIWYRAAVELNRMSVALGEPPAIDEGRLREFAAAFEEVHWDPGAGSYLDFDLQAGSRIGVRSAAGLAALFAGLATAPRARRMWRAGGVRSGAPPVATVDP